MSWDRGCSSLGNPIFWDGGETCHPWLGACISSVLGLADYIVSYGLRFSGPPPRLRFPWVVLSYPSGLHSQSPPQVILPCSSCQEITPAVLCCPSSVHITLEEAMRHRAYTFLRVIHACFLNHSFAQRGLQGGKVSGKDVHGSEPTLVRLIFLPGLLTCHCFFCSL